jgi:hypothetical protein
MIPIFEIEPFGSPLYATMKPMRLFITNILIVAMLMVPFQSWTSHMQCGCDDQCAMETIGDELDSCCPISFELNSDQPEPPSTPSDHQSCPASCCSMTVVNAFVFPTNTTIVTISTEQLAARLTDQFARTQPHLLRLKRPPRSA